MTPLLSGASLGLSNGKSQYKIIKKSHKEAADVNQKESTGTKDNEGTKKYLPHTENATPSLFPMERVQLISGVD